MNLTPAQREKIQRLLEDELRDAVRDALDRTDEAAVAELLEDRRRALGESIRDASDDLQDRSDKRGKGEGIAQQR